MSEKVKFQCPGCAKVLGIPVTHLGRQVQCPNCQTPFRAGAPPQQEYVVAEIVDSEPDVYSAQLVSQNDPFADAASPAAFANTTGQQSYASQGTSRRDALEMARAKKQNANAMTDSDERLQATGAFLVILPVIATLLPLFGVQMRRLAAMGEFAPLAAMFLGLIGVGCIAFARRNAGDAPIFGGAALLFVLITGIGGFLIVKNLAFGDEEQIVNDRPRNNSTLRQRSSTNSKPKANSQDESVARARNQMEEFAKNREGHLEDTRRRMNEAMGQAKADSDSAFARHDEIREQLETQAAEQRALVEQAITNGRRPFQNKNPFENSNPRNNTFGSIQEESNRESREPDRKNEDAEESDFVESVPHSALNGMTRSRLMGKWNPAAITFSKAQREKQIGSSFKSLNLVGTEQRRGKLFFYPSPVLGIEVIEFGGMQIVPLTKRDTPSELAIVADENQVLTGFNLAMDEDRIVGIQGVFDAPTGDSAVQSSSHWLGTETSTIQSTSNDGEIFGFICYIEQTDIKGFALVVKK